MGKRWYKSKTLIANAIALGALVAQGASGGLVVLSGPEQGAIITLLNLILRLITSEGIE